jgi:kumamolisin
MSPSSVLTVTLGLRLRAQTRLDRLFAQGVKLTPSVYDADFGPAPMLVRAAERWFDRARLSASWSPGDALLEVRGTADRLGRAFGIRLERYSLERSGSGGAIHFYAPLGQPTVPAPVSSVATSVLGLDDYPGGNVSFSSQGAAQCQGPSSPSQIGGFTPSSVAGFYNFKPLYTGGLTGSGQTVVFMEIDGFLSSDLQMYANGFGLPAFNVVGPVTNPQWGTPMQFGSACGSETELDLEIVHAMAPGAKLVVYESGINTSGQGAVLDDVAKALQSAIDAYPTGIFNLSLGGCEDTASAQQFDSLFSQLDAHGGTAFVSAGDSGAYERSCPTHSLSTAEPADSPHVTSVGGTTALIGQGSTYGSEAVWGEPFEQWGTGGGLSRVFQRPVWQAGPGVSNQYSNGMRQQPDVSAIADTDTGWDTVGGGAWGMTGGTSAAAPLWCALAALTDQTLAERGLPPIGLADPALYDFGSNPGHFPSPAFQAVTQGSNLYYQATSTGWNYGTGWGTPNASAVVDDFIAYQKGTR